MESKANRQQRAQTVCLVILSTVAVAVSLHWLAPVLVPFVLAIFITLGMSLMIDLQMRYLHIPRLAAMIITVIVGLLILAVFALLISAAVGQLFANAGTYEEQIKSMLDSLAKAIPLDSLGIDTSAKGSLMSKIPGTAVRTVLVGTGTAVMGTISQWAT